MMRLPAALTTAALALLALPAAPQPPAAPRPPAPAPRPPPAAAARPCRLLSQPSAPLRKEGTARVRLQGPGLAVDVQDAPAVCGAYYLVDTDQGGAKARRGDGLVFEACTPEGLVQVSSDVRRAGRQPLGGEGGVRVVFHRSNGEAFSLKQDARNTVSFGPELFSAEVRAMLAKPFQKEPVRLELDVRCPQ